GKRERGGGGGGVRHQLLRQPETLVVHSDELAVEQLRRPYLTRVKRPRLARFATAHQRDAQLALMKIGGSGQRRRYRVGCRRNQLVRPRRDGDLRQLSKLVQLIGIEGPDHLRVAVMLEQSGVTDAGEKLRRCALDPIEN